MGPGARNKKKKSNEPGMRFSWTVKAPRGARLRNLNHYVDLSLSRMTAGGLKNKEINTNLLTHQHGPNACVEHSGVAPTRLPLLLLRSG